MRFDMSILHPEIRPDQTQTSMLSFRYELQALVKIYKLFGAI